MNINENIRFLKFELNICLHRCLFNNRSFKMFNKTRSNNRFKSKLFNRTFSKHEKNDSCAIVSTKIFLMIIEKKNYEMMIL